MVPLGPLRPVLCGDLAFQLHREFLLVAVDVLQQTRIPHPMQVVGMAVKSDRRALPPLSPSSSSCKGWCRSPKKWMTNLSACTLVAGSALGSFRTAINSSVFAITH